MKKLFVITILVFVASTFLISETYAQTIYACVNNKNGGMRNVSGPGMCKKAEHLISWEQSGGHSPVLTWVGDQIAIDGIVTGPHLTGPRGIQGIQGIQGIKGDKGDKGDQGIQGIQGAKGDKGDKGDTGAQGLPGVANGVSRAAYGVVQSDGSIGSGHNYWSQFVNCSSDICTYVLHFDQFFKGAPHCIVTKWGTDLSNVRDDYAYETYYYYSPEYSDWFVFIYASDGHGHGVKSYFSFICVE